MTRNKKKAFGIGVMAGMIASLILLQTCTNATAEGETSFTPNDKFDLPSLGGKISFAVNGTYANATLKNDTWTFDDLKLGNFQPLERLAVSAHNCSIVIISYRGSFTAGNITFRSAQLRYFAEGRGQQTFNIGIAAGGGRWGIHPEWSVIVNDEWLGEGDRWSITPDGTVTVNGATGNVSIVHYGFLSSDDDNSNLPFHQQHSVAITIIALTAVTAITVVLIRFKNGDVKSEKAAKMNKSQLQCRK